MKKAICIAILLVLTSCGGYDGPESIDLPEFQGSDTPVPTIDMAECWCDQYSCWGGCER